MSRKCDSWNIIKIVLCVCDVSYFNDSENFSLHLYIRKNIFLILAGAVLKVIKEKLVEFLTKI